MKGAALRDRTDKSASSHSASRCHTSISESTCAVLIACQTTIERNRNATMLLFGCAGCASCVQQTLTCKWSLPRMRMSACSDSWATAAPSVCTFATATSKHL